MKPAKFFKLTALSLFIAFALIFSGCDNSEPLASTAVNETVVSSNPGFNDYEPGDYPQSVSKTIVFDSKVGYYKKFDMKSPNGCKFLLPPGAYTPPSDLPWGENVEITMEIELDSETQELQFTFGPHGSQFSSQATITLDYKDLPTDYTPTLYYIDDDGTYIEQDPNDFDETDKRMYLYVDHFSRYAIAAG